MKAVVIVGTGDFADLVADTIINDMNRSVAGYLVDSKYMQDNSYKGLPVRPFEEVEKYFPSEKCAMVIGFVGGKMYSQRYEKYEILKSKGYEMLNVVHSSAQISKDSIIGDGNIFLQHTIVAMGTEIGNCNVFTPKSYVCHHVKVGNANYFAPGVSTTGYCEIGNYCFLGVNSAINNKVKVADYTFVGGGKFITDNTHEYDVFVPEKSVPLKRIRSIDFQMFTSRRNQEK